MKPVYPCPCCQKMRVLEVEHHVLGHICAACGRLLSFQRVRAIMPVAYESGRIIHAKRGSNAVA